MAKEQELVKIVIPSYQRPDRVRALQIPNSIVCVPESEYRAYADNYGEDRVVAHPDSVKGIGQKRQWIIENFPNVFMIDDEYDHLVRCYNMEGEEQGVNTTPEETYTIIQNTAKLAKEMGTHLFGFSKTAKPLYYNPTDPFGVCISTSNLIQCGIGILEGGDLFIPEDLNYYEDDFLNLINCYNNRYCLVDKRFSYNAAQNDKVGMTTGNSNLTERNKDGQRLVEYFSPLVKKDGKDETGLIKLTIGKPF